MTQKFTILFDLDGTLVDTAPDLMNAHNHVMRKFGYETKSTDDIRKLVGQGAGSLIGRSVWGQAKKELKKINDDKIKKEMVTEFIDFYGKNIANESKLINGAYDFFEYVAGSNTFDFCKPDPRHLTYVIEIMQGDIKKSIMIGDSETDGNAAKAADIPFILLEDGYTEKNVNEISHNHLIRDFVGIEKIVQKYLHH